MTAEKKDFSSYTLLITYFLASVGILATVLVEGVELPFIFIMSGAAILTLVLNSTGKEILSDALWNVLAVAVLAVFIIDYAFISGSLIASASMFLTVLLVLKLFDLKKNRDYFLVYVIVFFQVLAAAASTVSPLFFLVLFLFIIGGIWAMIISSIKKDYFREFPDDAASGMFPPIFGIRFFLSIVVISVVSVFVASLLFFILPRMGVGFFERKTSHTIKVTGFSSGVDLEELGPIKKDSTIIMRVELGKVPGKIVYFRGNSLDRYDGKRWTKTIKGETLLKRDARGAFEIARKAAKDADLLEQNILLEPLDTDILFAASRAISIKVNLPNVWVDSAGSIRLPSPPYSRIEYRAISDLSEPEAASVVRPEYSDISYLEKDAYGARIKALAGVITKDARTDAGKATSIEKHLKSGYTYTLDPARNVEKSPLSDFLFFSRQGYCEHYATAMVTLLRSANVPARIVTGFLQGEWNGLGNYFIVRQEDAHSWVEAYIAGSGWVKFDPTPSAGLIPYSRPSRMTLYFDLLRWRWNRYIIHFSFADQKRIAATLEARTSGLLNSVRRSFRWPGLKPRASVIMAAAVLSGLVFYLVVRRKSGAGKNRKTLRFYLEMERMLRKKGLSRRPSETPMEFAGRTDLSEAKEITEAFQSVRYGGGTLNKDDAMRIKKALVRLGAKKNLNPF